MQPFIIFIIHYCPSVQSSDKSGGSVFGHSISNSAQKSMASASSNSNKFWFNPPLFLPQKFEERSTLIDGFILVIETPLPVKICCSLVATSNIVSGPRSRCRAERKSTLVQRSRTILAALAATAKLVPKMSNTVTERSMVLRTAGVDGCEGSVRMKPPRVMAALWKSVNQSSHNREEVYRESLFRPRSAGGIGDIVSLTWIP